jgi:hypothetical protein
MLGAVGFPRPSTVRNRLWTPSRTFATRRPHNCHQAILKLSQAARRPPA